MGRMNKILLVGIASWLGIGALAHAAPKISGSTSYQFGANNATVSISCDGITNSSAENSTGTIQVKLWAMSSPYNGGSLSGYVLGSFKLDGLRGGNVYRNVKKNVKCTTPPKRGTYFIAITVSEYQSSGYAITDWRNFSKTVVLSPPKTFIMEGPWKWQTSFEGGTINMQVAKISHTRSSHTGSLRLSAWATAKPYTGGSISGYQLGYVDKKALDAGYSYTNVNNTAKLKRPPGGNYYVSILLSEFNGGEYVVVGHLTSSKTSFFPGGE